MCRGNGAIASLLEILLAAHALPDRVVLPEAISDGVRRVVPKLVADPLDVGVAERSGLLPPSVEMAVVERGPGKGKPPSPSRQSSSPVSPT